MVLTPPAWVSNNNNIGAQVLLFWLSLDDKKCAGSKGLHIKFGLQREGMRAYQQLKCKSINFTRLQVMVGQCWWSGRDCKNGEREKMHARTEIWEGSSS
jgi:hypothetical protein